jgi:prefoldin subunit 2
MVLANISKLDPSRKCFRLIGGVLVEGTVGVVMPEVANNRDGVR